MLKNTSSDRKITVHERISTEMFPERTLRPMPKPFVNVSRPRLMSASPIRNLNQILIVQSLDLSPQASKPNVLIHPLFLVFFLFRCQRPHKHVVERLDSIEASIYEGRDRAIPNPGHPCDIVDRCRIAIPKQYRVMASWISRGVWSTFELL